jgi:serine/threonine protein kinase
MSDLPAQIGKYEVLGELGRGAMGTVFKARDPVLERLVALKTMSEALLVEEEMRERFYREARSAARLQHVNIVTIYELGEVEGVPFIAMELLDGQSLSSLMDHHRPVRLDQKVGLVVQICRGLDFAHKRGVIHRDIKPGNIQVLPDGTAKILDFGIALREGSTVKTKTGLVMGTPNYMAPEQIIGIPVDHRADMWAVGVILYELLGGRRPFESETIPSLIYRIVHQSLPRLDPQKLVIPQELIDVVDKALSKDPNARFRDLAEMASALQEGFGTPVSEKTISDEARESGYLRNYQLARALLTQGQPARGLEAARRAQALDPSRPEVVKLVEEIESYLRKSAETPTLAVTGPAPGAKERLDVEKWIDEARLALTAGNRTEALRIVDDVLTMEPNFRPAVELREILDKPAAPGRTRTGQLRTYTQAEIRLKRASSFQEQTTFGEKAATQVIAVNPRGNLVVAGGSDGSIRLWDLEARSKVATLRSGMHRRAGHEGLVTSLVFSEDGAFIASGHVDGAIHIWRLDTREELEVRLGHDGAIGAIEFSPDGNLLASGGMDGTLKLWDMEMVRLGEPQRKLIRQPAGVGALKFARGGALIVTGHPTRILRVHDVSSSRLTATLRGHTAAISFITVAPDGNLIASGSQDRTIRLFDLQRRAEVSVLEGHKKAVSSISFFPDGQQVASVAMEDNLILWDLSTGASKFMATGSIWPAPLPTAGSASGQPANVSELLQSSSIHPKSKSTADNTDRGG